MGVERVDYSSEDEYQQALQQEQLEYKQQQEEHAQEKEMNDCLSYLSEIVERYGYNLVEYCLRAFEPNKKKSKSRSRKYDGDEIPF